MNGTDPVSMIVPIKADRVFDSCSDKDCITNLEVQLESGELPTQFTAVKTRCCSVENICMTVEPIAFNRGYYSVDLTYTFGVELLAYERSCDDPTVLHGTATASKSVILYGSESSTKTFFSSGAAIGRTNSCCETVNLPTASCQCVDPIALETRIVTLCGAPSGSTSENSVGAPSVRRAIMLTLGIFSVVELTRPVTMNVLANPYTVPEKACAAETDSPCEIFNRLSFPAEEFSPQSMNEKTSAAEL